MLACTRSNRDRARSSHSRDESTTVVPSAPITDANMRERPGCAPRAGKSRPVGGSKGFVSRPQRRGVHGVLLGVGHGQLGRDLREGARELGADNVEGRDDRNRDQRRDQAVLDGGCTRLVIGEAIEESLHSLFLWLLFRWPGASRPNNPENRSPLFPEFVSHASSFTG